ncbi:retrovirus-related pol polyprotein from transposon tnt 1-94 [Gossypium australe]|uniref:Retrovirus-related pol polyprotein from transposon tnt 1-94 n=1 Tax=Gossypium australe TaxID=47621 RepID=A0A5B6U9L4_9ROSI|nr:retrovirus-related pol polyprotein from transposon tnt 1-94 [Gossypium australe]
MQGVNPVTTPLATNNNLCLDDSAHFDHPKECRTIIDSLQYLELTRLDITFTVKKLNQFSHRPTINHWTSFKRIAWYLCGTLDHGLFQNRSSLDLHEFPNVDWAGNKDDHTSSNVNIDAIQSLGALKSNVLLLDLQQKLSIELSIFSSSQLVIYCDNLRATYLSANLKLHSRMKHITVFW